MRIVAATVAAICVALIALPSDARAARPFTLDDLLAMRRVSDPQISPDGRQVAYVLTTVEMEKNATVSTVWLVPSDGGAPRQLTGGPKHDRHPRVSPDGKSILFESDRSG